MHGISLVLNKSPIVIEDSEGIVTPGNGHIIFGGKNSVMMAPPTVTILERISKENMDKQLDDLFASLSQQETDNLPGISEISPTLTIETEPPMEITTALYGYQKRALTWMLSKEDPDAEPLFWRKISEKPHLYWR